MREALTPSQMRVYNFIAEFIKENNMAPTVREIRDGLGLNSVSAVAASLERLRKKGYITSRHDMARSICIVPSEKKSTGNGMPPVSMALYRQLVFDCGAMLMSEDCDKNDVTNRLISLADRPISDLPDEINRQENQAPACDRCRNYGPDSSLRQMVCSKELPEGPDCPEFNSRYMTFPMTVNAINIRRTPKSKDIRPAQMVKVRLAGEQGTHLGFLLEDLGSDVSLSYNRKTQELDAFVYSNPPIFVPALNRVVFGYESWWSRINSEEDLKDITDEDIENTWYVKALRGMGGNGKK